MLSFLSVGHNCPSLRSRTICHYSTYAGFCYSGCIKCVPRLKLPWAHKASVPLSNLQQQQQRQRALMGSRLTVLCRAHVEAITADVSGMQICSKWLTICHSFNPPPPTISAPLTLYVSVCLCLYLDSLLFLSPLFPPTHSLVLSPSLFFSRSVQRGLWAAQWRIWSLFSTVSCVTSSTSDTRSLTTTSTPTTMHTNRYMGCTGTHTY